MVNVGLFTNFLPKNGVGGDGGKSLIFKDNLHDLDELLTDIFLSLVFCKWQFMLTFQVIVLFYGSTRGCMWSYEDDWNGVFKKYLQ